MLEAFTSGRNELPHGLLNDLCVLDDLADEEGHDSILREAVKAGVDLSGIGAEDMSAGEFATAVYLLHPQLLNVCHARAECRKVKNYEEYRAESRQELTLELARSSSLCLVDAIGSWFEGKHRSRACEIYVYQDGEGLEFQIARGRLSRTDPNWDKQLTGGRIGWRPQRRDVVIYDKRRCVLKVNAQFDAERDLYRTTFGMVLFGNANHFSDNEIYTLAPLLKGKSCLATVSGIDGVRQRKPRPRTMKKAKLSPILAVVHYRWHPQFGTEVTIAYREHRRGEDVAVFEIPDRSRTVLPAWMLDAGVCATMTDGRPRASLDSLFELHSEDPRGQDTID